MEEEWKINTAFRKFLFANAVIMGLINLFGWMIMFGLFVLAVIFGVE